MWTVIFHVVWICISLMTNGFEHFILIVDILCGSCGEMSAQAICPFLNCLSLCFWVARVLYIVGVREPYQIYDLEIFSFCGLSFISLRVLFVMQNIFNFDMVQLIYFSFVAHVLGIRSKKLLSSHYKDFPCFLQKVYSFSFYMYISYAL